MLQCNIYKFEFQGGYTHTLNVNDNGNDKDNATDKGNATVNAHDNATDKGNAQGKGNGKVKGNGNANILFIYQLMKKSILLL